jgi:hypothetical protein
MNIDPLRLNQNTDLFGFNNTPLGLNQNTGPLGLSNYPAPLRLNQNTVPSGLNSQQQREGVLKPALKILGNMIVDKFTEVGAPIAGLGDATGAGLGTWAGGGGYNEAIDNACNAFMKRQNDVSDGTKIIFQNTPREQKIIDSIKKVYGWIPENSKNGWRGIAEYLTTGDLNKASDVINGNSEGSSYLVPFLGTLGAIAGNVAQDKVQGSVKKVAKNAAIGAAKAYVGNSLDGFILPDTQSRQKAPVTSINPKLAAVYKSI